MKRLQGSTGNNVSVSVHGLKHSPRRWSGLSQAKAGGPRGRPTPRAQPQRNSSARVRDINIRSLARGRIIHINLCSQARGRITHINIRSQARGRNSDTRGRHYQIREIAGRVWFPWLCSKLQTLGNIDKKRTSGGTVIATRNRVWQSPRGAGKERTLEVGPMSDRLNGTPGCGVHVKGLG